MFKDIYLNNPSFAHRFHQLPFPDKLAAELESISGLFLDRACLSKDSLGTLEDKARQILCAIFKFWCDHANSEIQLDFLHDLHVEASDLIAEDFKKLYLQSSNRVRFTLNGHDLLQLASLKKDGYLISSFSQQAANDIKSTASPLVDLFLQNESSGLHTRDYLSSNNHQIVRNISYRLNHLFEIQGINKIMSAYVGYPVCIRGLAVEMGSKKSTWWQSIYPCSSDTLYIHRDESFHLPKAFVYINSVMKEDGAFSVFPNADRIHGKPSWLQNIIGRRIGLIGRQKHHRTYDKFEHVYHQAFGDGRLRSLFLSLPEQVRYSSHYGWDITREDNTHKLLKDDEVSLEGAPGSFLVFDGARISHRALQNSSNQHLSLQAIFCPVASVQQRIFAKSKSTLKTALKPIANFLNDQATNQA